MSPPRRPKGEPAGGQFTPATHSTARISLSNQPQSSDGYGMSFAQPTSSPGDSCSAEVDVVAVAGASRDPGLPAPAAAELMSVDHPVSVRHDTLNRGGRTVLTIAAADPNPAVRVAAHGSPDLPAAARYALSRDLAVQRLAGHQRIPAAS